LWSGSLPAYLQYRAPTLRRRPKYRLELGTVEIPSGPRGRGRLARVLSCGTLRPSIRQPATPERCHFPSLWASAR
jgi:hypothetical protein